MAGGKVGPPLGSHNGTKARPWSEALRKAALRTALEPDENGEKWRKLDAAATQCVNKAVEGDMEAIHELANRLDGKSIQPIAGVDGGSLRLIVELVYVEPGDVLPTDDLADLGGPVVYLPEPEPVYLPEPEGMGPDLDGPD